MRTFKKKYNYASSDAFYIVADAFDAKARGEHYRVPVKLEHFVNAFTKAFAGMSADDAASFAQYAAQRRSFGQAAFL